MSGVLVNKKNLPVTLELALRNHEYDKGDANLSATETILSPRIRQLRRFYAEREIDLEDRIYALDGSLTHELLEASLRELTKDNPKLMLSAMSEVLRSFEEGKIKSVDLVTEMDRQVWEAVKATAWNDHKVLAEKRLFGEIDGWIISGKSDLYWGESETVEDYKRCSVWNHIFGVKDEWTKQVNIYRWLLEINGYPVKKANIHAIFRDFQKNKAKWDKKYPESQWMVYPVELWPMEEIERYLRERVKLHKEGEEAEDPNTLPLCTESERWTSKEEWAVTKENRKRAIKLFETRPDATIWISKNQKQGEILKIEHRPGEDRRCQGNYCEVAQYCNYGRALLAKEMEARAS